MASLADLPEFRAPAAYWLSRQGDSAIPLLEKWMASADEETRFFALDALGHLGTDVDLIVVAALKDPSARVRQSALELLRGDSPLRPQADAEVARLLASDPDGGVRHAALRRLADHIPSQLLALSDKSSEVRVSAAIRLYRVDNLGGEAVPTLITALRDDAPTVRACAAGCLGKIGPPAAGTVGELTALLAIQDTAEGLAEYGRRHHLRENVKVRHLGDYSSLFPNRRPAYGRFGYMGPQSSRLAAARALGQIGPAATKAIPAIELLLKDADEPVRSAAAEALKKIRGEAAARE